VSELEQNLDEFDPGDDQVNEELAEEQRQLQVIESIAYDLVEGQGVRFRIPNYFGPGEDLDTADEERVFKFLTDNGVDLETWGPYLYDNFGAYTYVAATV